MLFNKPRKNLYFFNFTLLLIVLLLNIWYIDRVFTYGFRPHIDEVDIPTMVDVLQQEENQELLEETLKTLESYARGFNILASKEMFFVLALLVFIISANIYYTTKVRNIDDV